jgi:hypothetical protein
MDVHVIRYPDAPRLAPAGSHCEIELREWHRPPDRECRDLADVHVGDPGLAFFGCGRESVQAMIRSEACRLGANVALVRFLSDFQSACKQARARLLHCTSAEVPDP